MTKFGGREKGGKEATREEKKEAGLGHCWQDREGEASRVGPGGTGRADWEET